MPSIKWPEAPRAPEAPQQQRTWVILGCVPTSVKWNLPGADFVVDFEDPPRTTVVAVADRIARGDTCVVDVHPSGRFVLYNGSSRVYFLCDAHTRVATRLPTEPRISPRLCIGLIEYPLRRGSFMLAQLRPAAAKSGTHPETLVYYSTETNTWAVKDLGSSPHHPRWGSHGDVVTHDGKLWWVDLGYGMVSCDPFVDRPDLRYVPLPEGHVMADANHPSTRENLDKLRCVKASEGKLRYVEIHDVPGEQRVGMWTLADPERPVWEHEYDVLLEAIWADDSYTAAGLMPQKVPAIALIHPKNHSIVYFLQGALLFGVDMRASERRVVACNNCAVDLDKRPSGLFHSARFVHAWELRPTLLNPSSGTCFQLPPTLLPSDPLSEPTAVAESTNTKILEGAANAHEELKKSEEEPAVQPAAAAAHSSSSGALINTSSAVVCFICGARDRVACDKCLDRLRCSLLRDKLEERRSAGNLYTKYCVLCDSFGECEGKKCQGFEMHISKEKDGEWVAWVNGKEIWSRIFHGVERDRQYGSLGLPLRLHPPAGRRCLRCSDSIPDHLYSSSTAEYCSIECWSIEQRPPWVADLLAADLSGQRNSFCTTCSLNISHGEALADHSDHMFLRAVYSQDQLCVEECQPRAFAEVFRPIKIVDEKPFDMLVRNLRPLRCHGTKTCVKCRKRLNKGGGRTCCLLCSLDLPRWLPRAAHLRRRAAK